ncbi:hypothetical protein L218DRAFT_877749, partial [Marasmius fiardii PR-910]
LSGWECTRPMGWEEESFVGGDHDVRFGCVKPGWAADIVAVGSEDVERDFEGAMDRVEFVMKAGMIYKWRGLREGLYDG